MFYNCENQIYIGFGLVVHFISHKMPSKFVFSHSSVHNKRTKYALQILNIFFFPHFDSSVYYTVGRVREQKWSEPWTAQWCHDVLELERPRYSNIFWQRFTSPFCIFKLCFFYFRLIHIRKRNNLKINMHLVLTIIRPTGGNLMNSSILFSLMVTKQCSKNKQKQCCSFLGH